jgi:outer membrane protein TolC
MRPKLALEASATYTGVDRGTPSTAWEETFDQSHPTYSLGVSFSTSLEKHGEKAQMKKALAGRLQARSRYLKEKGDMETDWINSCMSLYQKIQKVNQLQEAFRLQSQRLKLDEERYRLGRLTLQNVIMAADELNQAELAYLQSQVEVREMAWKVKALDGSSQKYLQKFLKGWKADSIDL